VKQCPGYSQSSAVTVEGQQRNIANNKRCARLLRLQHVRERQKDNCEACDNPIQGIYALCSVHRVPLQSIRPADVARVRVGDDEAAKDEEVIDSRIRGLKEMTKEPLSPIFRKGKNSIGVKQNNRKGR